MAASFSDDAHNKHRNNPRRSKKSKRIDAARFFLHNISLGSRVVGGTLRDESRGVNGGAFLHGNVGPRKATCPATWYDEHQDSFEDDRRLILDLSTTNKVQLHHSTSVANTNLFQEGSSLHAGASGEKLSFGRSKSYFETSSQGSSKERQYSFLSQQRPDIHLVDSKQFLTRHTKCMLGKR